MRNYKSPIFQHRQYAAIAKVLADLSNSLSPDASSLIAHAFTDAFGRDNGKFDAARFYAAARGVPSNGKDKR